VKTYFAYDVNPRLLNKLLREAGQPLVGIKFFGPATRKVALACVGCEDAAVDGVVEGIIAEISGPRPQTAGLDAWESRLRQQFER